MLLQLISIGQNGRFEEAYQRALQSVPGATRIVAPKLEETWLWFYVFNAYDFQVSGRRSGRNEGVLRRAILPESGRGTQQSSGAVEVAPASRAGKRVVRPEEPSWLLTTSVLSPHRREFESFRA